MDSGVFLHDFDEKRVEKTAVEALGEPEDEVGRGCVDIDVARTWLKHVWGGLSLA